MAFIENADKVEIGASVSRSHEHAQLESPIPVLDTSDAITANRLPTDESLVRTSGTPLHTIALAPEDYATTQTAPLDVNGELHIIENIFSSTVVIGTSEQSGRKGIIKDILFEFSVPRHFDDRLVLVVMCDGSELEELHLTMITTTKWKADRNIEFQRDGGDMVLIVRSRNGNNEEFLTFTADEIDAMACAKEDTVGERTFTSVGEDIPGSTKIFFTVASSSYFVLRDMISAARTHAVFNLGRAEELISRLDDTENVEDITQAIGHMESAVFSVIMLDIEGFDVLYNVLGDLYARRFEYTTNVQDIDCAISHHKKAVEYSPPGHADLPAWFNSLGNSYLRRFKRTGDLKDINSAISHHQKAVESTPSGHADLPSRFNNLGNSYLCRFERTGDLKDINSAIPHHQKAVESTPSGHTDLTSRLNDLGNSYSRRFERTGDLKDINSSISHHQKAVESTPSGHADLPAWFNSLGNSYLRRFKRTGDLKDINSAISHHQKAVESTPSGHADLPIRLNNLGNSYLGRFERIGDVEDINSAISHHQKAVESPPSGHADLPSRLNNLGNSYLGRFERIGDVEDINSAISHHQKAVESTPSGYADLPIWLNNLGNSYSRRFEHTGNLKDINSAISHHQKAVESTPSGHADLPIRLNNLGNSYLGRFERIGDVEDINSAISHHQKAVESTPSGHADLPSRLNNLGNSYSLRFECTGDLVDINSAISHHQQAIESLPSGHADLLSCLNNLGNSYLGRFERIGDVEDINSAISHHQKVVESTPSGHAGLPRRFSNLGNSYSRRFTCTGDLKDINSAISHHQKAVESPPSGHADLPTRLNSLGNSYSCRFDRTGDLKDINSAISHQQKGIEFTPSGHANLPRWLNNLGNSYSRRFTCTGDLKDINSAISHHQKAVEFTPSGHADLPGLLNNLGNSYSCRFERTGDLKDFNSAISHQQKAVEFTPSGHANLPSRLHNLGNSSSHRFERSQYFPDIKYSITSYRRGAASNGAPSIRLQSAKLAARQSFIHDRSHCLIDFSLAITMLSEVAGLEQTVHRRHANLLDHSDFLALAVRVALSLGRPDSALEWLEQGRCLVWNQINQLRTPVDSLRMNYPPLADRFIEVAMALESHGTRSSPSFSGTLAEEIRVQDDTLIHTVLAADYRKLIEEIQSLPDFDDFLRPPKAVNLLSSLPADGPVIIFNIHEIQCDALALIAGVTEPLHIPLKDFNLVEAETLKKALQVDLLKQAEVDDRERGMRRVTESWESMSGILRALWDKVVQPILAALGYSFQPNLSARRRIWWCPTGPLAFLPLHAAGIYGPSYKPGLCVSDFAVSSYTPTVQSLNQKAAASSTSRKCTDILLVNPNTPSLPAIPFTQKEVYDLKVTMDKLHIRALLLEDEAATTEKVKVEMNTCNWVHFACHGIQDVRDPLKSGVHLRDGRLELLEIMRQKLSNPEFAFLSACQTSKGDLKLSEEVVHLAAGMLAAGYRGVVGTMWSISDRHGPEFAKLFYEYLLENMETDGLDSTKAAYALDYATRKVRDTLGDGDDAFLTWVPYVHFGY